MREGVKGFPLFKVTFKHLRDLEEDRVIEILNWYKDLKIGYHYQALVRLYKENTPDFWKRAQKRFPSLPEYGKLQYKLQIFVDLARRTMPVEIKPEPKKEKQNDISNSDS